LKVEEWLRGTNLTLRKEQVTISEYRIPEYNVPSLSLYSLKGDEIASLKPVGIRILGAIARVDLVGAYGSRVIVYLLPGGPALAMTISEGGEVLERQAQPLFPGVSQEGWYTVDQRKLRAHLLDRAIFFDLVREVSDYEVE
jgi:hypothetical protein